MGAEKILQQFSKIKSAFTSKSKDIVKQLKMILKN